MVGIRKNNENKMWVRRREQALSGATLLQSVSFSYLSVVQLMIDINFNEDAVILLGLEFFERSDRSKRRYDFREIG